MTTVTYRLPAVGVDAVRRCLDGLLDIMVAQQTELHSATLQVATRDGELTLEGRMIAANGFAFAKLVRP